MNAASGAAGDAMAPGTIVSLFGSRMGPVKPAVATYPEKGLGGTRVFFEDTGAYLTFAGWSQVNALVPNSLPPGAATRVRIEAGGLPGSMHPLSIVPASPGIFSADGSGSGQAVVVNQDASFNSPGNPAARGSVIPFFATGLGRTNPGMQDGSNPEPAVFPAPVLPVQVVIGGREVPVPDLLFTAAVYAGVLQVNVRIPGDAPAGERVELLLRFRCGEGKWCSSQPRLTLATK